jgi:PhnB protein
MLTVMPYLLFDGYCAEVMEFYKSCFGGHLTILRVCDTPMKEHMPPEQHGKVAYAHLESDSIEFSATDWLHPQRTPRQGNTVCMYLTGKTYRELKDVFDKLAVEADPTLLDDLRDMPFGTYGHLADKYGVHWFFRGDEKSGA